MKLDRLLQNILITIYLLLFSFSANAWPTDNKVDKVAKPNQSIVLFKLFLYDAGRGCISLPAPQATAQGETLGKVSTRTGRQKLPQNLQSCGKDFEAEYIEWVYLAGQQSGIDKFKIYYYDGQGLIPINVSVAIGGISVTENNSEPKINLNDTKFNKQNTVELFSNPIFEKIRFGMSIIYDFENHITQTKGKLVFIVSEKTEKEFVTVVGDNHIVYNPYFERIKSGNWSRNKRSCDGIIYPFEINKKINFTYSGTYIKNEVKETRQFNCERKITGTKQFNYKGSNIQGWTIENTELSTRPDGGHSVFQFNGTFSEEMGTWLEVSINERVDKRLIMSIEWKLSNISIPDSEYQIKTTMCSGSCDTATESLKVSMVDPKKYKTKNECEQNIDAFKKNTQPVPIPTSFIYDCIQSK